MEDGRSQRDSAPADLGFGIGWRPAIDRTVQRLPGVDFVEVIAEIVQADAVPPSLGALADRGVPVVPHGVSLSLGGATAPDGGRLDHLSALAETLGSPLVSEHVAFCRAGGMDAGHMLPVPRTHAALEVLSENVRMAQDALPVPLALENIAAFLTWPDNEMSEGAFLSELVHRTGVWLLVDVENLYTAQMNFGLDPLAALDELPLEKLAYVHVAGGELVNGIWHDTHAHPVPGPVLDLLGELADRVDPPGVLLERDDRYPPDDELAAELGAIRDVVERSRAHAVR
jgi:uncharacterized protein